MPSKAVVALSVALVIAVAMCVYLYLYPRGTPPEVAIPVTLPEWMRPTTVTLPWGVYTYTNPCPSCRAELTRTLAKATVGPWEISIVRVAEARYVKYGSKPYTEVYTAREGYKLVIVTGRARLVVVRGPEPVTYDDVNTTLVTREGNVYPTATGCYGIESPRCLIRIENATKELLDKALEADVGALCFELPAYPGQIGEGDVVFMIPENESPSKLRLYIRLSSGEEFRGEIPLP
ncbi:MAG: hypothetical protein LM583_04955 [Desulfurococcaceae archaeon]|jgi:hypothetical protein|nr:hypothetical protein [Desulfurococcaceae archaeon]